jgi:prolyl oligopeptidase
MKIFIFAFLLLSAALMSFASDKTANDASPSDAPAKPSVIEGGNGVTLPPPPPTEAKPVTDAINGQTINDPYRWLEDAQSHATRDWIAAQMKYTEEYMAQVKVRPEIVKRLTELVRVETYSIPFEAEGKYFFTKRLPEENQASIYMRKGLTGPDERLIDATKLSSDQQTNVSIVDVSKDASLMLYAVREGGADEESVHILDVNTGKEPPDVLPKARYLGVSLTPDKQQIYYSKFDGKLTQVYLHRMGAPVGYDQKIFGGSFNGETFGAMELISVNVSENGRYLVIDVNHGVPPKRVDVYVKDLRSADAPIKPIIHGIDNRFTPANYEDDLYVLTDYQADNFRIIRIKLSDPAPEHWQTIVPEGKDPIEQFSIVGGKLFATDLQDVVTQTRIFARNGKQVGTITYPTLGAASTVFGRENSKEGFYNFQSFNIPPTIYHYNVATGKADVFARPKVPFSSDDYEVKQVFYTSKDGTRVPMFVSSKKGVKRDGTTPTLMFAYGGFLVNLTPAWNPEYAWWMEQGGIYAQPNLRGGGEYGEAWHKAGMFEKKQNVFDDFFAAAQYLIDNKYTSPARLAIRGRSNGGLLMGVAMTQHPEMFGAIWCGYPLLDMLRYQNFLVGRWWTSEYGSAENAEQFPYLIKYSPYHNVRPGTKYPAIMFNSGDSDTRVDPLHARKMTALMQADAGSDRPILLHYQLKAGHSAGVSITQLVTDTADELAFLWNEVSGNQVSTK